MDGGIYRSRHLMDLGEDPRIFIRYPYGRSFYIDECVEDSLRKKANHVNYDDLERAFTPFIRSEVRHRYGGSMARRNGPPNERDVSGVHIFDKRRLSFLRTGSMNQRRIDSSPARMFQPLAGKSRDELEQGFMMDESGLSQKEIKSYVYVIFDLQRHFDSLIAREMPQGLDQEKVESHLLRDICSLNRDAVFWAGMDMEKCLHEYLVRYLIMFFDSEYDKPRLFENMEFNRFNQRRYFRQTRRPQNAVYAQASSIFGLSDGVLKSMNIKEIQKLYRKKARELHPDRGGSHDRFIELGKVYEELMETLK